MRTSPIQSAERSVLMTSREFADSVGMRMDKLYILWAEGRGPEKTRRGKHIFITREETERWKSIQDRSRNEAS